MGLEVPSLSDLSLRVAGQALVCDKQEGITTTFENLLNLLKTQVFTCVSETVLSHLVKCHATYLSDTCTQALCPSHLKQLSFSECNQLTWTGVKEVLSRLHSLQAVDLSFCSEVISPDVDLISDFDFSSTLTCVALEECSSLSDSTVQHLLRQAKSLRNLNISSCDNITDKVFLLNEELQLSREAHGKSSAGYECQLASVDLSGCRSLTSTVVRHLASLTGPTLRSVNLSCVQVDCMALLYLCGYGLVSAVSLMVREINNKGLTHVKDLAENLQELRLLQAKRFRHWSNGQDAEMTSPSIDEETQEMIIDRKECGRRKPILSPDSAQETSVEHHVPINLADECAGVKKSLGECQRGEVITKEHEDDTLNKTDGVILEDDCDIAVALEAFSSDSICIQELENTECCFEDEDKTRCGRFLKSRNRSVEEQVIHKPEVDDINLPSNESSWDLQINQTADETVNILLSAMYCPGTSISSSLAEKPCSVAASLPSKHSGNGTADKEAISIKANSDIWDDHPTYNTLDCKERTSQIVMLPSTCQNQSSRKLSSDLETGNKSALVESRELLNTNQSTEVDKRISPSDWIGNCGCSNDANDASLEPVQMYIPGLVSLDVSYANLRECSGNCLVTFFQHNRNLAKFAIHWQGLTNGIVTSIASQGEMLEEISLIDCDQVTCPGIQEIGKHCQKLRGLDLKGVCFFKDAPLWPCLSRGQLRHLSLAECGISDVTLRWICQNLSETIESLDLAWCDEITESGVNALLSRDFKSLRTLSLHQGPASDHTLALLADHCSQLTSLVLCSVRYGIEDEAVVNLAQHLPQLKKIDISWNSGLTDESPVAFLTFCQKLEWANFAGIKRITSTPFIRLISDDGSWLKKQALLRKHQLARQRQQVEDGEIPVVQDTRPVGLPFRSGVFAPRLSYLDLVFCDLVDDFHLAGITAVCRGSLRIQDYHGQLVEPVWFSQCPIDI